MQWLCGRCGRQHGRPKRAQPAGDTVLPYLRVVGILHMPCTQMSVPVGSCLGDPIVLSPQVNLVQSFVESQWRLCTQSPLFRTVDVGAGMVAPSVVSPQVGTLAKAKVPNMRVM